MWALGIKPARSSARAPVLRTTELSRQPTYPMHIYTVKRHCVTRQVLTTSAFGRRRKAGSWCSQASEPGLGEVQTNERETLFEQEVLHQRMDIQGTYGGSYTYVRPSLNKQNCRKWVFYVTLVRKRYLQCSLIYWGHLNFYCAKNSRYKHPSAGEAEYIKAKKYKRNMMTSK